MVGSGQSASQARGSRLEVRGKATNHEPRATSSQGFTFIELIIAATIMSVLFVGLGTHLQGGVRVWRRVTGETETLRERHFALDQFRRELVNAIAYDPREEAVVAPYFGHTELRWVTVRPTTAARPGAVEYVTYRCAEQDGVQGLWRTGQAIGDVMARQAGTPVLLAAGCAELAVEYAYAASGTAGALQWRDTWTSTKEIPRLVALEGRFEPGRPFRELVWIPTGTLPKAAE